MEFKLLDSSHNSIEPISKLFALFLFKKLFIPSVQPNKDQNVSKHLSFAALPIHLLLLALISPNVEFWLLQESNHKSNHTDRILIM